MAPLADDPSPICPSCGRDTGLYDHDLDCPEAWLTQDKNSSLAGSDSEIEEAECGCKSCRRNRHLRDVILPRLRSDEDPDWTLADLFGTAEEDTQAGTGSEMKVQTPLSDPETESARPEPTGPEPTRRGYKPYEPTLEDFEEYDAIHLCDDCGRYHRPIPEEPAVPDPKPESTPTSENDEEYEIIEEIFWCESCNAFHSLFSEDDDPTEPQTEPEREQEHDLKAQVVFDAVLDLEKIEWCEDCGKYHPSLVENLLPWPKLPVSDAEYDAEDEEEEELFCEDCSRCGCKCDRDLPPDSPLLRPAPSETEETEAKSHQESDSEYSDDEDDTHWCEFCCCYHNDESDPESDDEQSSSDDEMGWCEQCLSFHNTAEAGPAGQEHADLARYLPVLLDGEDLRFESLASDEDILRVLEALGLDDGVEKQLDKTKIRAAV
ncbi:hypothetical protein DL98DRAFT_627020 [Cadophora sp. DSE1049]|nr:hypothetical protein DL98DRAFT_627020 [Cadophora sp. DSE1049]